MAVLLGAIKQAGTLKIFKTNQGVFGKKYTWKWIPKGKGEGYYYESYYLFDTPAQAQKDFNTRSRSFK